MTVKRTIFIISEETRYGEESWDLGVPDDIELEQESFYFDTKYGELDVEDIQAQVERLKELLALTNHISLPDMIQAREEWIAEQEAREHEEDERDQASKEAAIEAARKLLRDAGELTEVPDGIEYDGDGFPIRD